MKSKSLILLFGLGVFCATPLAHQKEVIDCPPKITPALLNELNNKKMSDWRVQLNSEMKNGSDLLYGGALFYGPPEDSAELVPDGTTDSTSTWNFLGNEGFNNSPIWIGCRYRDATAMLFKQVQIQPKKCVVFVKDGPKTSKSVIRYTCTN